MKSLVTIITMSALAATAKAGAPEHTVRIPVAGVLTDAEGNAVNGTVSAHFYLYEHVLITEPVWHEEIELEVEDGRFATSLGNVDAEAFRQYSSLYLAMAIANDAELGRWPLTSTPYAAYATLAGDTTSLAGRTVEDFVLKTDILSPSMIANQSIGASQLAFDPATEVEMSASATDVVRQSDTIAWEKIVGVPADFADGIDDVGGKAENVSCSGCISTAELDFCLCYSDGAHPATRGRNSPGTVRQRVSGRRVPSPTHTGNTRRR